MKYLYSSVISLSIIILFISCSKIAESAELEYLSNDINNDCISLYKNNQLIYNDCGLMGAAVTDLQPTDIQSDFPDLYNSNLDILNTYKLESSDFSGGEGITYTATGTFSFDCSEVEGVNINCVGEDITIDTSGLLNSILLGSVYDVSTSTLVYGHVLMWNGASWQDTATSSLGIVGGAGGGGWDSLDDMILAQGNIYAGNASNYPSATSSLYIDASGDIAASKRLGIGEDVDFFSAPGDTSQIIASGTTPKISWYEGDTSKYLSFSLASGNFSSSGDFDTFTFGSNASLFKLDVSNSFIRFGDYDGAGNSTEVLLDDSNQKAVFYGYNYIGFGTSTPAYLLDVYGNARIDGTLIVDSVTGNLVGNVTGTASGNLVSADIANYMQDEDINTISELNTWVTDATLLISGGTLTNGYVCRADGTGGAVDCDLVTDGSGACAAGAVCTGGHTHVGVNEVYGSGWNADTATPEKDDVYDYLHFFDADDDGSFVDETWFTGYSLGGSLGGTLSSPTVDSDSDWTAHNNYPTGCTNQFVTAIGDTLTCATVDGEYITNDTIDDDSLDLTDITLADFTDDVGYWDALSDVDYFEKCFTLATSSFATYEDSIIWSPEADITISKQRCRVVGGTSAQVNLSDNTNDTDQMTCATTLTEDASLSNNSFSADEAVYVEFGSVVGNVTSVNFCIVYSYD